jgi:hypothetical protein
MNTPDFKLPAMGRRSFFRWVTALPLSFTALKAGPAARAETPACREPDCFDLPPVEDFLKPWLSAHRIHVLGLTI